MKKVIYFSPMCEWNDFVGFNGYLKTIKNQYDEICVVVPKKAKILITEADSFITIDDEFFGENNYPKNLEIVGHKKDLYIDNIRVTTSVRNSTNFFEVSYNFIKNNEYFKNYEIKFYENEVNLYDSDINKIYYNLFNNLKNIIADNTLIMPEKHVYENTVKKYSHILEGNNKKYVIITRNFKNKAIVHNTSYIFPELEEIIDDLTKNNIKIINIGFPAQKYNIQNDNYIEISNENISQEELISIIYECDGVLLAGNAGGFSAHILSNADVFLYYPEFSASMYSLSMLEERKKNINVYSGDITKEFEMGDAKQIIKILKNHKKIFKKTFSKEKPTTFVKYKEF